MMPVLGGVVMELQDCALPLLRGNHDVDHSTDRAKHAREGKLTMGLIKPDHVHHCHHFANLYWTADCLLLAFCSLKTVSSSIAVSLRKKWLGIRSYKTFAYIISHIDDYGKQIRKMERILLSGRRLDPDYQQVFSLCLITVTSVTALDLRHHYAPSPLWPRIFPLKWCCPLLCLDWGCERPLYYLTVLQRQCSIHGGRPSTMILPLVTHGSVVERSILKRYICIVIRKINKVLFIYNSVIPGYRESLDVWVIIQYASGQDSSYMADAITMTVISLVSAHY